MKFRYYITDTFDGCIKGTNDEIVANELSACEEYFVVDCLAGKWLAACGEFEVPELAKVD